MQSGVSNKFTVSIVEDGESAPSYVKTSYAWSASYEAPNGASYPTDITPTSWSEIKPSMPANKPACWVREQLYNWYEPTRTYVLVQTTYRCETAKPQMFDIKGYVIYVQDGSGFPTSPTPESRALALVTNDGNPYIYLNNSWQRGSETAAVNDAYMVSNPDATYGGANIYGHMFVWNGSSWKDMGEIKGPPGDNGQDACSAYISNNTITFDTNYRGHVSGATSATIIDISYLKGSTRLAPNSISINGYTVSGETQIEQNFFASIVNSSSSTATLSLYCKSIYSTVELDLSGGMKNYPIILSYAGSPNVSTTLYVKGNMPTVVSTDYYYYMTDAPSLSNIDSRSGLVLSAVPIGSWSTEVEEPTVDYNFTWQKIIDTYSNNEKASLMSIYKKYVDTVATIKMGTVIQDGTISKDSYISEFEYKLVPTNTIGINQLDKVFYLEYWFRGQKAKINKIIVDIVYPDGKPVFNNRQIGAYLICDEAYNGETAISSVSHLPFIVNANDPYYPSAYPNATLDVTSYSCNRVKLRVHDLERYYIQAFKNSGETEWSRPLNQLVYRLLIQTEVSRTDPTTQRTITTADMWETTLTVGGECKLIQELYDYTCHESDAEEVVKRLPSTAWTTKESVTYGNLKKYLWERITNVYNGGYRYYSYRIIDTFNDGSANIVFKTALNDKAYNGDTIPLNPSGLVLENGSSEFKAFACVDGGYTAISSAYMYLSNHSSPQTTYQHRPIVTLTSVGLMNAVSSPSGNPSSQNYYELKNSKYYIESVDIEVVSGKTYYTVSNSTLPSPVRATWDEQNRRYNFSLSSASVSIVYYQFNVAWEENEYVNVQTRMAITYILDDFRPTIGLFSYDAQGSSVQYIMEGEVDYIGNRAAQYEDIDITPLFQGQTTINKGKLHGLFDGSYARIGCNVFNFGVITYGCTWLSALLPTGGSSDLAYRNITVDVVENPNNRRTLYKYVLVLDIGDRTTTLIKRYKITLSDTIVELNS